MRLQTKEERFNMGKNISASEDMLLDFYLDATTIKNAMTGLVMLIEQKEERSEEIQMQDLAILKDVAKAIKSLASNHAIGLGEASGYE